MKVSYRVELRRRKVGAKEMSFAEFVMTLSKRRVARNVDMSFVGNAS